ncbi:MAG TPA: hypothetical protein VGL88_09375 [Pseudonocardiaceae bacterium]|jgi:hypothetical protein
MSDVLSFAVLNEQRAELLPARTVLSMFAAADPGPLDPNGSLGTMVTKMLGIPGPSTGADGSHTDGASGSEG